VPLFGNLSISRNTSPSSSKTATELAQIRKDKKMNHKPFFQFAIAIILAGLGLWLAWGMLGASPVRAQGPDTWEKADLYGAPVEFEDLVMAANGDLYVCLNGVGYGVYKLAKGATTWQVSTDTGHGNCDSLVIDNVNSKLYQIGGKPDQYLWRSDDSGLTWTKVYTPPDQEWSPEVLAINPVTPTILHMTLHDRGPGGSYTETVHRSEDSGVTWTQAQFSPDGGATYVDTLDDNVRQIAVDPTNPRYVYLRVKGSHGDDDGLYVSSNDGISYTKVLTADIWSIGVNATPTGTVFAIYDDKLWRSADHGQTWQELDTATDCGSGLNPDIAFHTTLSRTLFIDIGGGTICRSDDEGDSWTVPTTYALWGLPVIDPTDLSTWFMASKPGVWKTPDGGNYWSDFNEGLSEVAVRRIAASPSNPDRYWVMTGNGVGFTQDGGETWKFPLATEEQPFGEIDVFILTTNAGQVIFHPTNHDRVYLTQIKWLYIFDDWTTSPGWGSWLITPTHVVTVNAAKPDLRTQDLVLDPTNPLTGYLAAGNKGGSYADDGDGVYKTTDGGLTWNTTSLTLPIRSLALVTQTSGVTVYAGTMDADGISGRIYRSTDGGSSWENMGEFPGCSFTTIAVDWRKPLRVFAGASCSLGDVSDSFFFISQDGGATWEPADFGQYKPGCGGWIANIVVDPKNPDHIYFAHATNGNICYSQDGGQTWELPLFIWAQQWGIGQACVVDINRLPPGGSGLSVQAGETVTQSLMYMGATSGVYRQILVDSGGGPVYLPVILKASS
jgi:photosystem II stability/assembly factor-like uncharacterized protein